MHKTKAKKSKRSMHAPAKPTPARKPKPAAARGTPPAAQPADSPVDPRVLAAIGLALHEERLAAERIEQLERAPAAWTIVARAARARVR